MFKPMDGASRKGDKLAVLMPGMGAVATTFIAGVGAMRRGRAPIGSVTQTGFIPDERGALIPFDQVLPLAAIDDLVFGGWDIYEGSAFGAAERAGVLHDKDLEQAREVLEGIEPMAAVFDQEYVRNLSGPHVKSGDSKMALAEQLIEDIERFKREHGCDRAVGVWCGSTEVYTEIGEVHQTIEAFEQGLRESHEAISPSMIYAYAFVKAGVPYANGAPNMAVDLPAIMALARREGVAIAGKDFKTGQTLMKTILAPGFAARQLGVRGWYSTNILGNTDGQVLDDPGSFRSKEKTKLSVLESILDGQAQPEPLRQPRPQGAHRLLPSARRQQGGLGQHRHLRLDGLPDADQDQLPVSRFHPGGAARARSGVAYGRGGSRRARRRTRVALLFLQRATNRETRGHARASSIRAIGDGA